MTNRFLIIVLSIVFQITSAQEQLTEKQFEMMKPFLYEQNQKIFYEGDYLPSIINPNFVPEWKQTLITPDLDSIMSQIRKNSYISIDEYKSKFGGTQTIKLTLRYRSNNIPYKDIKVEIVENLLKDSLNNDVVNYNSIGLGNGSGVEENLQMNIFAFKINNSNSPIKGKIKFKVSFLTSYNVLKINDFKNDSIFNFQNSNFKILQLKENFMKFQGMDSLADQKVANINYENLDKNLKEVIANPNEREYYNDNNNEFSGERSATLTSFPSFLFDEKVKFMSFDEYSEYLDQNIKTKSSKIHLLKFETKIQDLYFYEKCYNLSQEFEIDVDEKITVIE